MPSAWLALSANFRHSPLLIGLDFGDLNERAMFTCLCCRADRLRSGRAETYLRLPQPIPGTDATLWSFGIHPIYPNTYLGADVEERLTFFLEGILDLAPTVSDKLQPIVKQSMNSRLRWAVMRHTRDVLGLLIDCMEHA